MRNAADAQLMKCQRNEHEEQKPKMKTLKSGIFGIYANHVDLMAIFEKTGRQTYLLNYKLRLRFSSEH